MILDLLGRHERTVAWLARKMGVSNPHMHRIVHGERPLTASMASRLAELFGEPVETFLPEAGDE